MFDLILIYPNSPRAYRAAFPYKPCDSAIRGFHGIGMVWQKQMTGGVYWSIPCDKVEEAADFIQYWYGGEKENRQGKRACAVRVLDEKPESEVELTI